MIELLKTGLAALLLSCIFSPSAVGAVIYTDVPDTGIFGPSDDVFFEVDLNGDGTTDFRLRSNFSPGDGFSILPQGNNSAFSTTISPPDINTFAIDFDRGSAIGPSILGENLTLIGQRFASTGREIGVGLLACALFSEVVCLGQFDLQDREIDGDTSDFAGVALELDGKIHFGYIEILSSGFNGGAVRSFAFESEAGVPILAGSVPEPSTSLLVGMAVLISAMKRSRSALED